MKTILITLAIVFSGMLAQAQTDTIFRMNGDIILANVTGIDEGAVNYSYPNESFSNDINKSSVYKIHFKSGRKEEFSSIHNVLNLKSCLDWEEVQISSIPSEVQGMFKIDDVSAKSQGNTKFSSLGKMQSRTLDKVKMQSAMIGANTCYISHQNTEGKGYKKTANVAITATGYTSKKVYEHEVMHGEYQLYDLRVLRTNNYNIDKVSHNSSSYNISENMIKIENGFPIVNINFNSVPKKIEEYTIIYASDTELILSGIYSSHKGKTTYYNVFLKKDNLLVNE